MKKEIRVLGIDDSPFDKFKDKFCLVTGVLFRGGEFMDGVLSTQVSVDGKNATTKLIAMINTCKFKTQLKAILLDGIALAGFNVIDIVQLHKKTRIPVIVVMRSYPNFKKIESALRKISMASKIKLIHKAGDIHKVGKIHIQIAGIDLEDAKRIIHISTTRAEIPEAIRVAHLIGAGIVTGESKGNA